MNYEKEEEVQSKKPPSPSMDNLIGDLIKNMNLNDPNHLELLQTVVTA